MRGRPPIPTAIKRARGNPGRRPIPEDEPQPSTEISLEVPAFLEGDAAACSEWKRTAPMLHRLGLLSEADVAAWAMYCSAFSRWQEAEQQLRRYGLLITVKGSPYPAISPYLSISNKAQAQCRLLLMEFGLSPTSRTRVHLPKKQTVDAQRDRFFGPGPRLVEPPTPRR